MTTPAPATLAYRRRVAHDYPFESAVPQTDDVDLVMDHIMRISFLSSPATLDKQSELQDAELYAFHKCQLQCKRDGRMRRERVADDDDASRMTLSGGEAQQDAIMQRTQKAYDEGRLSSAERRQFVIVKQFREQLAAIPWAPEPETAEAEPEPEPPAPAPVEEAPKPFLAASILSMLDDERLDEADKAEQRFEAEQFGKEEEEADEAVEEEKDEEAIKVYDAPRISAADLRPAIPHDAVAPTVTAEQLALDPNNPALSLQPIKERENRYSYAAKFDDLDHLQDEDDVHAALAQKRAARPADAYPENVAGYAADGSIIPVQNSGTEQRADLPPVYADRPEQREKLMREQYDPALDKPFLWNKAFKFIVVSCIGPNCPQKAPRTLVRVWGGVGSKAEGEKLMLKVVRTNRYGYMWRTYLYSIQRWFSVPPRGKNDAGTVAEGNNQFADYLQASFDHQKQATAELEARALDAMAQEKSNGDSIIEQLKKKNLNVDVDPRSFPRGK